MFISKYVDSEKLKLEQFQKKFYVIINYRIRLNSLFLTNACLIVEEAIFSILYLIHVNKVHIAQDKILDI